MRSLSRRDFLRLGGAAALTASAALLRPERIQAAPATGAAAGGYALPGLQGTAPDLHLVATDGWIYANAPAIPPFHPDDMAPPGLTTYIFGFRNTTGFTQAEVHAQKMKAQLAAPLFFLDENVGFTLQLTNLGLQLRPDLIDSHTIHFHGFRNQIPIFDGEPHSSVGVPIIRDLTYFYRPHDPGTYMYHCHFEETEHVHMGMVGPVFVRPALNQQYPGRKFAYNNLATEYDREFVMTVHEVWSEAHWCDSHVQLPEWTDYKADLFLLNGRAYPDTLLPHGGDVDPATKDLLGPIVDPATGARKAELRYQPMSSLVRCAAGDRVLLRFINLGYSEVSMRLSGIRMKIVGRDAAPLTGRDGTDLGFVATVAPIGPGETADAIFTAPAFVGGQGLSDGAGQYDRYLLYNRALSHTNGGYGSGYGGQMTEVRVYRTGTLGPQTAPNL